ARGGPSTRQARTDVLAHSRALRRLLPGRADADHRPLAPAACAHAFHRSSATRRSALRPRASLASPRATVPARQHADPDPPANRRTVALQLPGTVLRMRSLRDT